MAAAVGGPLVLAVHLAGSEEQLLLLCAALLDAEAASGPELWLGRAFLRQLTLAAGRHVWVWPMRRPPLLGWVLILAAEAGRTL